MNVSWTRYDTYKTCSLKYHLTYQAKVKTYKSILQFIPGRVVHDIMEAWGKNDFASGFVTRNFINSILGKNLVGVKSVNQQKYNEMYLKIVKALKGSARVYAELGIPKHRISVEPRFNIPLGDSGQHFIIGGWDVLDLDTQTVYDLKVTTSTSYGDPGQLETYAVASSLVGQPVKRGAFILPLLSKKLRAYDFTPDLLKARENELLKSAVVMTAGVQPTPNPGNHCFMCDYNGTSHCPATYRSNARRSFASR